jgi:hypothetical protein
MRVFLVYPEFPDTFWSFKHALRFIRKKAGAPPLGLLTVAALLPSEWDKRLVDLNVDNLTPPRIRIQMDPQYILALGRSISQLGIRGAERVHYWRLFFWTLFWRPRLFPLAMTLAISGFHFRQVVELHVG